MKLTKLVARCVACGYRQDFAPPPVTAANEPPMCPKCFAPMVVESAEASS